MHLNQVSAGHGWVWVKQGLRVFFKQPLAMAGLFFMFMMGISLLAVIPLVGTFLAVALVPAGTLGLMAAAREADAGRFPMPLTLLTAFREGSERSKAMWLLGGLYAAVLLVVMLVSSLLLPTEALQALQGDQVDPEITGPGPRRRERRTVDRLGPLPNAIPLGQPGPLLRQDDELGAGPGRLGDQSPGIGQVAIAVAARVHLYGGNLHES